jgi:cell filamentation protein
MDKYDVSNDLYCFPNSPVLKNKLDIENESQLENAEREITEISIGYISYSPPPYNLEYLKRLHHTLFSELYNWAGEIRRVDISKGSTRFCNVSYIIPSIEKIFTELCNEGYLKGIPKKELAIRLGYFYGEFNMVHPFREGNGRVQRVFFEHLALSNGFNLEWSRIKSKNTWIEANIESALLVEYEKLEAIFEDILAPI